jgi:DNA-binding FadR family transcriptional regulator
MELAEMMRDESCFIELLESRLIIEPQLAFISAQIATEDEIAELANAVKRTEMAYRSNTYTLEIGFEFHRIIARIARNRFLVKYIDSIKDELKLQRGMLLLSHMSGEDLKRELNEHKHVYELISQRQAENAREAMYQHLETALEILRKGYK